VKTADYLYGKRRLGQIDSGFAFSRNASTLPWSPIPPLRDRGQPLRAFSWRNRDLQGRRRLEHVVSIVGIDEVDLDRGYISWRSPLANALMKASPGDRVHLRAPAKTEYLEIIEVEYARFRWILSASR